MVIITQAQFLSLLTYLEGDRQMHVRAHGKWHLDEGKLSAALASADIEVGEPEPKGIQPIHLLTSTSSACEHPERWKPGHADRILEVINSVTSAWTKQVELIAPLVLYVRACEAGVRASEVESFGFSLQLVRGGADPEKKERMKQICLLAPPSLRMMRPLTSHNGVDFWNATKEQKQNWPTCLATKLDHAAEDWCRQNIFNVVVKKDGTEVPLLHAVRRPPGMDNFNKRKQETDESRQQQSVHDDGEEGGPSGGSA